MLTRSGREMRDVDNVHACIVDEIARGLREGVGGEDDEGVGRDGSQGVVYSQEALGSA
jgi:hypothetical protein